MGCPFCLFRVRVSGLVGIVLSRARPASAQCSLRRRPPLGPTSESGRFATRHSAALGSLSRALAPQKGDFIGLACSQVGIQIAVDRT